MSKVEHRPITENMCKSLTRYEVTIHKFNALNNDFMQEAS